jgi:von Willebrand factor type A domain
MKLLGVAQPAQRASTPEGESPIDGDVASWFLSLLAHLGLLVALGIWFQSEPRHLPPISLVSLEPRDEEVAPQEVQFAQSPLPQVGANSMAGLAAAMALAPTPDDESKVQTDDIAPTEFVNVERPLMLELSTARNTSETLLVKGAAGVGTTGAEGAIDRITQEILLSLEQRPTLVVWLFDQSGSLQMQRASIDKRFDRIYQELGLIEASGNEAFKRHADKPLLTSVVAFGERVTFRIPQPTDDLAEIKAAVRGIENDASGVEMTFTAIGNAAQKYQKYRTGSPRRNVMLVVISDEAGDDESQCDATLALCRRQEMPVYVVGVPAPFGRREALMKYVDPDPAYSQTVQMIPVVQGPESALPERIKLGFSSQRDQDDLERLDSGFGPYSLTRLCYETGGIYFAVHANRPAGAGAVRNAQTAVMSARINHFFDPTVMRNYRPDYMSLTEYQRLLKENKARAALVQAAQISQVNPMDSPRRVFPKRSEADLKNELDLAQRAAAVVEPKVDGLYVLLKQGEKDRQRLTGLRWQAGYDLAMGRVLAVKVRTFGYNAMLAKAKMGMKFEKADSDTWALAPSDEISVGSALEKLAAQAREYLSRVKDQHPGTPWALLAERELADPLGWKWTERHTGVNEPRPRPMVANNNPKPPQDTLRKLEKPKPVRQNVKL